VTSSRILNALASYLRPLVEQQAGSFELSGEPQSTLDLLRGAPGTWRCILQWQREDRISTHSAAMRMTFLVIVQHNAGLPHATRADVAGSRAGDPALLHRMEQVIAWVRACELKSPAIDTQLPINPQAIGYLAAEEFPGRQVYAEFPIVYGMSGITRVPVAVE